MNRLRGLQLQIDESLHLLGHEWGCMGPRGSSKEHRAPEQVIMPFNCVPLIAKVI